MPEGPRAALRLSCPAFRVGGGRPGSPFCALAGPGVPVSEGECFLPGRRKKPRVAPWQGGSLLSLARPALAPSAPGELAEVGSAGLCPSRCSPAAPWNFTLSEGRHAVGQGLVYLAAASQRALVLRSGVRQPG